VAIASIHRRPAAAFGQDSGQTVDRYFQLTK